MVEVDTWLNIIITILVVAAASWGIIRYLKQEKREREENEAKAVIAHDEALVKRIKEQFENSIETVRGEISTLSDKATKQLRRQNRRSDFTNSNVRKVRTDTLDLQADIYTIKKAMMAKQIIVDDNGGDAAFKREMARKKTEIERDDQEQMPKDDDEE